MIAVSTCLKSLLTLSCDKYGYTSSWYTPSRGAGLHRTDMTKELQEAVRQQMLDHIPLRSFGDVADAAAAMAFLASKEAKYIMGQVLTVDGGLAM